MVLRIGPRLERDRFWAGEFSISEGFEFYRCPIDKGDIALFARIGARRELHNHLADTILYRRKRLGRRICLASDIESTEISPRPDGRFDLIVKIRVGQEVLGEFLKHHVMHGSFTTQLTGRYLAVLCCCGDVEVLDASSIR